MINHAHDIVPWIVADLSWRGDGRNQGIMPWEGGILRLC
jgi:hypothetical protein